MDFKLLNDSSNSCQKLWQEIALGRPLLGEGERCSTLFRGRCKVRVRDERELEPN
jgi:hypothetical protein